MNLFLLNLRIVINSKNQISTNRWILHIMAFAFFWLVCGELIVLHQKAIYGFDPFNQESPFAKTDNSSSKSKMDKTSKFDKYKDQYHFDAILDKEIRINTQYRESGQGFTNTYSIFISQSGYPLIALRAPPSV